jgi:hypothetical protein
MADIVTEIISSYGSYYLKGQNNMSRLVKKMMQGCETLNLPGIRHINSTETIYQSANVTSTEVVQGYQHNFTPKGDTVFHPNTIYLRPMKVDKKIQPDVVWDNWLGFLSADNKHPKEWPIVRYIMEEIVAGQIEEDRELKLTYTGVYQAPTEDTPGDAVNTMDGFKKIMTDAAAASHVYPIHKVPEIGELNSTEIFDQVERFEDGIPGMLKNKKMYIFMAPEMATAYFRKLRDLGFYDVSSASGLSDYVDKTQHLVKGIPCMTGTTDIWATLPGNILHLTKRSRNNFKLQEIHRDVDAMCDWWEGLGFEDNNLVFASTNTVGWNTAGTALVA